MPALPSPGLPVLASAGAFLLFSASSSAQQRAAPAPAGIEIMSPAYHALRDGNPSTLPASWGPGGDDGGRGPVRVPGTEGQPRPTRLFTRR